MNLSNRKIEFLKIPKYFVTLFLIIIPLFRQFKNPLFVLMSYLREISPDYVCLKNNNKFFLSNNADIITVVAIFCKYEYGKIEPNSTIIDIGANIGVFSLYCAIHGAKKVYSFEPSEESFEFLNKNIVENGFEKIIVPFKLAVHDKKTFVNFPSQSNPSNKISDDGQKVETTTLDSICEDIDTVDLLKIDCEGSEHIFIPSTSAETFSKIKEIRMEYHEKIPIIETFTMTKHKPTDSYKGLVHFSHLNRNSLLNRILSKIKSFFY